MQCSQRIAAWTVMRQSTLPSLLLLTFAWFLRGMRQRWWSVPDQNSLVEMTWK